MSEKYQLVIAFPNQEPAFAHGVAWQMFREKCASDIGDFRDYQHEEIADSLKEVAALYGRKCFLGVTDWPGWSLVTVSPKMEET